MLALEKRAIERDPLTANSSTSARTILLRLLIMALAAEGSLSSAWDVSGDMKETTACASGKRPSPSTTCQYACIRGGSVDAMPADGRRGATPSL